MRQKPRNPYVAAAKFRRAGAHEKTGKARRRQDARLIDAHRQQHGVVAAAQFGQGHVLADLAAQHEGDAALGQAVDAPLHHVLLKLEAGDAVDQQAAGAVVPVIDLSVRFGRAACPVTKRSCIVIIETVYEEGQPSQQMGIVVDAVSEVLDIPASDIEPPPEFGARIRTDFISGMGKINGKFVVLLDVNRILSIDEVAVVAALGQGNGGN